MRDILITYDSKIDSEGRLKNLIRTIEKDIEGYNEIMIVGPKPEWLQGVLHRDLDNAYSLKFKCRNDYRKLKSSCLSRHLTDDFLWIDASFKLCKIDASEDFRLSIPAGTSFYEEPKGVNKIIKSHTDKRMYSRGFFDKNDYFNPYPMSFNKSLLLNIFEDFDFETMYGYCIKTMYTKYNRLKPTGDFSPISIGNYEEKSSYENIYM